MHFSSVRRTRPLLVSQPPDSIVSQGLFDALSHYEARRTISNVVFHSSLMINLNLSRLRG